MAGPKSSNSVPVKDMGDHSAVAANQNHGLSVGTAPGASPESLSRAASLGISSRLVPSEAQRQPWHNQHSPLAASEITAAGTRDAAGKKWLRFHTGAFLAPNIYLAREAGLTCTRTFS